MLEGGWGWGRGAYSMLVSYNNYIVILLNFDMWSLIFLLSHAVVNVSVESSTLTTSELAGSVEVRLLKTDNAIGPVTVLVSTVDGTAQSTCITILHVLYR